MFWLAVRYVCRSTRKNNRLRTLFERRWTKGVGSSTKVYAA